MLGLYLTVGESYPADCVALRTELRVSILRTQLSEGGSS